MIERGMINIIVVDSVILRGSWPKPTPPMEANVEDTTAGSPLSAEVQVLDLCS